MIRMPIPLIALVFASLGPMAECAETEAATSASANDDILIADFEGPDYGKWKATGDAFGDGPAQGTLPKQGKVDGYEGKGLANSYHGGDAATGTLISPPFTIERKRINFLIGGGIWPKSTGVHLLIDGEAVMMASGPKMERGGSERLWWQSWDVSEFKGQQARIQIVDRRTKGGGHINVDQIMQSDTPFLTEKTWELKVTKRYLNLPVVHSAPKTYIRLMRGEEVLRSFVIELTPHNPDYWVALDLSEFQDATLTLWGGQVPRNVNILEQLVQADRLIGSENLYHEKYRPQFHFSAIRGWINDPNGLVYYKGEYHLFFQHNPYSWTWGNMTWGHAVSKDLVHWEELGDAIHPDGGGTIFSGSGVVDWNNTTGFQTGDEPPLVVMYTYVGPFSQNLAYSNDRGRTLTNYAGNPVQEHIVGSNRDPKVFWHEPSERWVSVLFLDEKQMGIFTSKDMKEWTKTCELKAFYECPEMFALALDGDKNTTKWVLYGASGDYFVGTFDGKTFTPDGEAIQYNYGDSFYASQTFNDIPKEDGRRIQIAFGLDAGHKSMPFNQMMNFPVVLTLRTTGEGPRMCAEPVKEIELLYKRSETIDGMTLNAASKTIAQGELFDITAVFETGTASEVGFKLRGLTISWDAEKGELRCKDKIAPLIPENGRVKLRLLVDRVSVEIFANDGRIYMPMHNVAEDVIADIKVFAKDGQATLTELTVHELASAWEQSKQGAYAGTEE